MIRNIPSISDLATRVLELARETAILRPRGLGPLGIPSVYLSRLQKTGRLDRIGRGLYTLASAEVTECRSQKEDRHFLLFGLGSSQ